MYFPLTDEQKKIIKKSILFKIMVSREVSNDLLNVLDKGIHSRIITDIGPAQQEIQPYIQMLIDIVDYEMATINHIRRIKKQNESIVEFYKATNTRQIISRISLLLLTIILVSVQVYSLYSLLPKTDVEIINALIGMCAAIDIAVVPYLVNKWRLL